MAKLACTVKLVDCFTTSAAQHVGMRRQVGWLQSVVIVFCQPQIWQPNYLIELEHDKSAGARRGKLLGKVKVFGFMRTRREGNKEVKLHYTVPVLLIFIGHLAPGASDKIALTSILLF